MAEFVLLAALEQHLQRKPPCVQGMQGQTAFATMLSCHSDAAISAQKSSCKGKDSDTMAGHVLLT